MLLQTLETSPNFFDIPRELRDLVYCYLIDDVRLPPANPDQSGDRLLTNKIYFQARSPRPALLQLKLCSKRTNAEVNDILAQYVQSDTDEAHLDVMVKGSLIWPTWIYLPVTRYLDPAIRIDLRLFEAVGWGSEFSTGAYRGLWALFNALVSQGPCLIQNRIGGNTPLRNVRLRFRIHLCFATSAEDLYETYRDVFDRLERLAFDNVGLGNVVEIEAILPPNRRVWRLKQLPTGFTIASRIA